jgi:Stage II sporulation protein E (SpoIIE)
MTRRVFGRVGRRLVREPFGFIGLILVASGLFVLTLQWPDLAVLLAVPLLVGGLVLTPPSLILLVTVTGLMLLALGGMHGVDAGFAAAVAIVTVTAVVWLGSARSRARLGVRGTVGEAMLVDLRDRLLAQGEMPALPRGWEAEVVHRSAGGASFSGDFLVAARSADRMILEVALVDVSGKGLAAGTRALLLSGAFGGLLGSLPPAEFLPAANAYLLRQEWVEGFATAVHLVIDLETGGYEIRSAGHPPAVRFTAGSGRWETLETTGGLLGVVEKDDYPPVVGRLRSGDALMLYTDGLVETPRRDISDGIDKLQGEAERLVGRGFRHGARRLIDAVSESDLDDRALVLIWRR